MQLIAASLVVLAAVAVAGGVVSRRTAESESVHELAQLTDVLAQNVVQPVLTDAMASSAVAAHGLDSVVRSQVLSPTLIRVKVWTPDGTIIYSDEPRLVGRSFGLDADARAALSSPQTRAGISNVGEPENVYERGQGKLVAVYRPIWTPSGKPLLFETYSRYTLVSQRAAELWRGFSGVMISNLLAFLALLTPLVWTLLARARRAGRQRMLLLQRSVAASEDERRRIAAALHDGVVQELAAASFAVAGGERVARGTGETELAQALRAAGDAIRTSIGGMRSLLLDIYPASLRTQGLIPALTELGAAQHDPPVFSTLDEVAADRLCAPAQEAVYRVAQEAVRNAARHGQASRIGLTLREVDGDTVLEIVDDGIGFDVAGAGEDGHFGLELMTDAAAGVGAELSVWSATGAGTRVQLRLAP